MENVRNIVKTHIVPSMCYKIHLKLGDSKPQPELHRNIHTKSNKHSTSEKISYLNITPSSFNSYLAGLFEGVGHI